MNTAATTVDIVTKNGKKYKRLNIISADVHVVSALAIISLFNALQKIADGTVEKLRK